MLMRVPGLLAGAALILVTAGCTGSAAPSGAGPASPSGAATQRAAAASPGPSQTVAVPPALLAVGRSGEADLRIIESPRHDVAFRLPLGAPDAMWGHIFTATPDGADTRLTNVLFGEDTGRQLTLQGRWHLPTIGDDPVPVGRSLDDSTVVLVQDGVDAYAQPAADAVSRFAVVRAAVPPSDGPLELVRTVELKGAFDFDALSANGAILYVIEHLNDGTPDHYQVRSVDVTSGRMDDAVVVDKATTDEAMAGRPITQLRRADGTVLTLYRGAEHPFVHVLSTAEKWALCVDLPANGADDASGTMDWGLTEGPNPDDIYAVNASLGVVAEIHRSDLTVGRTARIDGPATPASAAAEPALILAKFGHEPVGRTGRRAVVDPTGALLLAGGRDGLVAVRTKDLSVAWRALPGDSVKSVAFLPDGRSAFVLLGSGRIVAVDTEDGSDHGTVFGDGYDRLVAITG